MAASIATVSPTGDLPGNSAVRQLVATFDEAVVALGDPRRGDPLELRCKSGPREWATVGSGRWLDERRWAFDMPAPLPPGLRCTLRLRDGWAPLAGVGAAAGAITGRREYAFSTGAPLALSSQPYSGATIEEDQVFLLRFSGPPSEDEVLRRGRCDVEGLAERVPLRLVGGAERDAVIQARRLAREADRLLLLACSRPLPPQARIKLVLGRGMAAPEDDSLRTGTDQVFDFRVREPFHAEFSCERERANAPCLPIRPLLLRFSAPVARAAADAVRLQPEAGGAALKPVFDRDDATPEVSELRFPAPLPERAGFTLLLPPGLRDNAGRALANAGSFPLRVATGEAPPLAKFAAAPFGVIERLADPVLPITLRHVQGDLVPGATRGQLRAKRIDSDADILAWYARLKRYHESRIPAREAGLPAAMWTELIDDTDARGRPVKRRVERQVATRELSLLRGDAQSRRLDLPALAARAGAAAAGARPFEVIGLPLPDAGFHIVEVESLALGQSLLDKSAPMFVRTGVLVTNLGVHFKRGRENALVWVTSLDRGKPVADADVAISDCRGKPLWQGRSGPDGSVLVPHALGTPQPGEAGVAASCPEGLDEDGTLFVSARKADAQGRVDLGFVFDGWNRGVEPWRFDLPISRDPVADVRAASVLDRSLLRAGETVSMKHLIRRETATGLAAVPAAELPTRMRLVHDGSGDVITQPLAWTGNRHALSRWVIPISARLGLYRIELDRPEVPAAQRRVHASGEFRVEAFRVPLIDARLAPPRGAPVAPAEVLIGVQLEHQSGGGVGQAPLSGSALLSAREPGFAGYEAFSFAPPRGTRPGDEAGDDGGSDNARLVVDKAPLRTDGNGAATWSIRALPKIERASELLAELSFEDPNGEVQTVATTVPLWPAAVVPAIKAESWVANRGPLRFTALALDLRGQPLAGQAIEVRARQRSVISARKRLVGGLYAYDNRTELKELGAVCSGKTDAQGRLVCEATLAASGQIELIAGVQDGSGHRAEAAAETWIARQGELWFEQDNHDRIELVPEKRRYESGETARLQVRMPYRDATALVTVEREGVLHARVQRLRGDNPTVEVKIDDGWAPNIYVSVLVQRGRIREVPWSSFFQWGWKTPLEWWRARRDEGPLYQPPTARVDLAKPSFKLGVAALQVGRAAHELQVQVVPDKTRYKVRGKALVTVKVSQRGQPVAGAEVAFAAVDEGLLALRENTSWDLLSSLLRPRAWGVETATAQGEIVGRRHYGRKAVAPGGGGGRAPTRELFDTLLLWRPVVMLDAKGEARLELPLNDSLTRFRLVAVADDGASRFGSGSASIQVSQDLQMQSGLPPLVREGDRFDAVFTLRNTTAREMKLRASLASAAAPAGASGASGLPSPAPQELNLAAGAATTLRWTIEVPARSGAELAWDAAVEDLAGSGARDRLRVRQRVEPAVPVTVQQGGLLQLETAAAGAAGASLPVARPAALLPGGGLGLSLQPGLAGAALPGVRFYFERYAFSCLEQQASKVIALRDLAGWAAWAEALPAYLDADGLAAYFPLRAEDGARGSDRLSAYLVSAAHEAGLELPAPALDRLLGGLSAFVQGRIERRFWSPRTDLDARKLAAIEALSRHGRAEARWLGSIALAPALLPNAALIDWLSILQRLPALPDRAKRLAEAQNILRSRLDASGTTLALAGGPEEAWWLMDSADASANRLLLVLMNSAGVPATDSAAWQADLPRLMSAALARQRGGAWSTTTANLWGALALEKFGARFEAERVDGRTVARLGAASTALDWSRQPQGARAELPWPAEAATAQAVLPPLTLAVSHQGAGRPWLAWQSRAAVPLMSARSSGYALTRQLLAVQRKDPARWSRGDIVRVRIDIDAAADLGWVALADPLPAGAVVLGSGLGRDSAIAAGARVASGAADRRDDRLAGAHLAFEERTPGAWRGYFEFLPRGRHRIEYTLRLNNPGRFGLPPTRIEAMYAPDRFGELPNAAIEVAP